MGEKNLESIISSIGDEERKLGQKQAEIDRLTTIVKKQKIQITEQEQLINELKGKMDGMYDLPADVEALKRMIGEQRAEINTKDTQLEIMNGRIAELEAELKGAKSQIEPLTRNLDGYISQIGELKAALIEQQGNLKFKEKTIMELEHKIQSLEDYNQKVDEQYQAKMSEINSSVQNTMSQVSILRSELAERDAKIASLEAEIQKKDTLIAQEKQLAEGYQNQLNEIQSKFEVSSLDAQSLRSKIETELREDLLKAKGEMTNEIASLKNQLLDREIELKEVKMSETQARKQRGEINSRLEEMIAKYDQIQMEFQQYKEEIESQSKILQELKDFKEKNKNISTVFNSLAKLFEQEPLFKTFNIVRAVGEMNIDDLKNSLGVPSITTKKYIKQFVDVGLFKINEETGKISLVYELPINKEK